MVSYTFILSFKGVDVIQYRYRIFPSDRAFNYYLNKLQLDSRFAGVQFVGGLLSLEPSQTELLSKRGFVNVQL